MRCVYFATFTATPDGTLAATGKVYNASLCADADTVLMSPGEVALLVSASAPVPVTSSTGQTIMVSPFSTWTAADGVEAGWMVGGIWIAVAGVMMLAKAAKNWGTHGPD